MASPVVVPNVHLHTTARWLKIALWVQGVLLVCFLVTVVFVSLRFTQTQRRYAAELKTQAQTIEQQKRDLDDRAQDIAFAWFNWANETLKRGDARNAAAYFKNALDTMPGDDWSRRGRTRALVKLGKATDAEKEVAAALKVRPTAVNYVSLALAECGEHRMDLALETMRTATAVDGRSLQDGDVKQDCPALVH